ncbi:MAG: hypothetical protein ACHQ9S_10275 [Candidatus Binatia bacterium]
MLGFLIGGLFTFLFGGMVLMLILGAQGIEARLKEGEQEAGKIRTDGARIPRFFVVNQPVSPRIGTMDEALVWQVQQYLEAEQILADEFVLQPSIESLYRESGRRITTH